MAINVVLCIIAIGIPTLLYSGCVLTRKKRPPVLADTAPHFELDRAA